MEQRHDFMVTNDTDDDRYQIVVPVEVEKQKEENFDLYLWPEEGDNRRGGLKLENGIRYIHCTNPRNDTSVMFAEIPVLRPKQEQGFTLIHKSGPQLTAVVKPASSTNESQPYDKTPNGESGVITVPGGYSGCHIHLSGKEGSDEQKR